MFPLPVVLLYNRLAKIIQALILLAVAALLSLLLMEVNSSLDIMPGWVILHTLPMENTPHFMHIWTA